MNPPAPHPETQPPADAGPELTGITRSAPVQNLDPARCAAPATIDSASLLCGNREALIVHAGEVYRLRLTRNGKLLLTK